MKKIKYIVIGIAIGIIIVGSISVYAVEVVIDSREVSYDNETSHGSYEDVQGSIDELYERSGVMKEKWIDPILNGADPVFDEKGELIPVTIADDGTVKYANLYTKWYEYETKRWANAVILVDSEKGKYKTGDEIPESAIESYFVWIPRYKYKIWDLGNYTTAYSLKDLKDSTETAESDSSALRLFNAGARLLDIVFQKREEKTVNKEGECAPSINSGGGSNCHVGDYMTHPAFTLGTEELNGLWIGKFEIGSKEAVDVNDAKKTELITTEIIKPNAYSWRYKTVKAYWYSLYNYKRDLDSHMMKNTEWGAVAYLSHSAYGLGTEVNINNNSLVKTGYSATANTDQSVSSGIYGTDSNVTQPWNTSTGYLASTTANISGIYDMSGGHWEAVAAYMDGEVGNSGLTITELSNYSQYFDKYSNINAEFSYSFNRRILGDATGEMGPFYIYFSKNLQYHGAWYADAPLFVYKGCSWFMRGGNFGNGNLGGLYSFFCASGDSSWDLGTRLVLAVD